MSFWLVQHPDLAKTIIVEAPRFFEVRQLALQVFDAAQNQLAEHKFMIVEAPKVLKKDLDFYRITWHGYAASNPSTLHKRIFFFPVSEKKGKRKGRRIQ